MTPLKHTALATAIAAASFASSAALAAEASTGPKFYGTFYVTLDYQNEEISKDVNQWALNSRNSNLGVRQEIPLQNGISAIYQAEFGLKVDDGSSSAKTTAPDTDTFTVTQRNTYIGLKSQYGQVIAGRFDSPLRASEGKVDPFNHLLGDIDAVLGGQNRVSNIVQYSSPAFSNTVIHAAFMPGENKDLDGDGKADKHIGDAFSTSAVYGAGNLYAALALDLNMATGTSTEIDARSDRLQLVGQYKLDALTLGAIVQHAKDSDKSKLKENALVFNGTYQINAYKLKAQLGANKGSDSKNARQVYALGVDFSLSPAAFVTADFGSLDQDPKTGSTKTDQVFTLGYNLKF